MRWQQWALVIVFTVEIFIAIMRIGRPRPTLTAREGCYQVAEIATFILLVVSL